MFIKLCVMILVVISLTEANYDVHDVAKRVAGEIGAVKRVETDLEAVIVQDHNAESKVGSTLYHLIFDASFDYIPYTCYAEVLLTTSDANVKIIAHECNPKIPPPDDLSILTDDDDMYSDISDLFDIDDEEDADDFIDVDDDADDIDDDSDADVVDDEDVDINEIDSVDAENEEVDDEEENLVDNMGIDLIDDSDTNEEEGKKDDIPPDDGEIKKNDNCVSAAKLALKMIPKQNKAEEEMLKEMEESMGMDYEASDNVDYKLKSVIDCKVTGTTFKIKLETEDGSFCNIVLNAPNLTEKGATMPQNQCQKQN